MIVGNKVNSTPEVCGSIQSAVYHIKPENVGHLMGIMRDMYADPILAVIREYSANATDAHMMVPSLRNKPIVVKLPTVMNPIFSVQDFGPGLSPDEFVSQICGIGTSGDHKRISNDMIGGLGIGAKCAHAVCDQFTYTICHKGTKYIWSCYKDEHDMSKADCLSQSPCNNESGCLIEVPVKLSDRMMWHEKASNAFTFYAVKPEVHNIEEPFSLETYKGYDHPATFMVDNMPVKISVPTTACSYAGLTLVMGGLRYPLDLTKAETTQSEYSNMAEYGWITKMVIHAPIGFVQLAPSRESLRYSTFTKSRLSKLFNTLRVNKLGTKESMSEWFGSLTTDLQRIGLWSILRDNCISSSVYRGSFGTATRDAVEKVFTELYPHLSHRGVVYKRNYGVDVAEDVVLHSIRNTYEYKSTRSNKEALNTFKIFEQSTSAEASLTGQAVEIEPEKLNHLIVGYTRNVKISIMNGHTRELMYRSFQKLSYGNRGTVIQVQLKDGKSIQDFIANVPWLRGIDESSLVDMDALKPRDKTEPFLDTDFRSQARAARARSSGRVLTGTQNYAQHGCKLVKWSGKPATEGSPKSQWWSAVQAKDLNDAKQIIYVPIHKFEAQYGDKFGEDSASTVSNDIMHTLVKRVAQGPVYGIRVSDLASIKSDSRFVNLFDHLKQRFYDDVEAGNTTEEMINWLLGVGTNTRTLNAIRTQASLWFTEFVGERSINQFPEGPFRKAVEMYYKARQILKDLCLYESDPNTYAKLPDGLKIYRALSVRTSWVEELTRKKFPQYTDIFDPLKLAQLETDSQANQIDTRISAQNLMKHLRADRTRKPGWLDINNLVDVLMDLYPVTMWWIFTMTHSTGNPSSHVSWMDCFPPELHKVVEAEWKNAVENTNKEK